jgi:hypothetical protein
VIRSGKVEVVNGKPNVYFSILKIANAKFRLDIPKVILFVSWSQS